MVGARGYESRDGCGQGCVVVQGWWGTGGDGGTGMVGAHECWGLGLVGV